MSLSRKQWVSLVALVLGCAVFLGAWATLTDFNDLPNSESGDIGIAKLDCMAKADYDECADRVDREFGVGAYAPIYERHPVAAALLAGVATFFVIAGGSRLFME